MGGKLMASVFYFHNGQTADTVRTLTKVLENLDEDTFKYHCNKDKHPCHVFAPNGEEHKVWYQRFSRPQFNWPSSP
jgi:hypothetical protein